MRHMLIKQLNNYICFVNLDATYANYDDRWFQCLLNWLILPVRMFIKITYYYCVLTIPWILFIGILLLEHDV